jgi:hypothetical protein
MASLPAIACKPILSEFFNAGAYNKSVQLMAMHVEQITNPAIYTVNKPFKFHASNIFVFDNYNILCTLCVQSIQSGCPLLLLHTKQTRAVGIDYAGTTATASVIIQCVVIHSAAAYTLFAR